MNHLASEFQGGPVLPSMSLRVHSASLLDCPCLVSADFSDEYPLALTYCTSFFFNESKHLPSQLPTVPFQVLAENLILPSVDCSKQLSGHLQGRFPLSVFTDFKSPKLLPE